MIAKKEGVTNYQTLNERPDSLKAVKFTNITYEEKLHRVEYYKF